jgi:hypothetical protein
MLTPHAAYPLRQRKDVPQGDRQTALRHRLSEGGSEMQSSGIVIERTAPEAPVTVRGTLRALIGRFAPTDALGSETPDSQHHEPEQRIASPFENRLRTVRANAAAAYDSVEGDHAAALNAALAVVEAEWLAARAEREAYAEALKTIRTYGRDADSRIRADRALAKRPEAATLPCATGSDMATFSRAAAEGRAFG